MEEITIKEVFESPPEKLIICEVLRKYMIKNSLTLCALLTRKKVPEEIRNDRYSLIQKINNDIGIVQKENRKRVNYPELSVNEFETLVRDKKSKACKAFEQLRVPQFRPRQEDRFDKTYTQISYRDVPDHILKKYFVQ